ncbi:MAG TPA: hypothetical protein VNU72_05765 [Puia sp.]|nr:hypothetical protein [Puia sp.]
MQEPTQLIQDLNRSYQLELAEHLDLGQLEDLLAEKVNLLIRDDFERLVQLLYRVDVSENKLRALLAEGDQAPEGRAAPTGRWERAESGRVIARLIMERQWQKIETRRKYSRGPQDAGEEEW